MTIPSSELSIFVIYAPPQKKKQLGIFCICLKNYSKDVYLEELNKINFPDYSKFTDINDAYSDFIGKVSLTIDKIAPMKEIRIKNSSKEWFDEEILEEIEKRDKLLAKFKKSRQPSDSQNYKIARNKVQGMIKKKQKNFIAEKLNQNIGKPKELWKSLKSCSAWYPSLNKRLLKKNPNITKQVCKVLLKT